MISNDKGPSPLVDYRLNSNSFAMQKNYKWNHCKNDVNKIKNMLIFFCNALFKVRCSSASFGFLILVSIKIWRPYREGGWAKKIYIFQDKGEMEYHTIWISQSLFSFIGKKGKNCTYQQ